VKLYKVCINDVIGVHLQYCVLSWSTHCCRRSIPSTWRQTNHLRSYLR